MDPFHSPAMTGRAFATLLLFAACATQTAWAATPPAAISCRISGVPLHFESIDPVQRAPQSGQGRVLVDCTNASHQHQAVDLVVFDSKTPQRPLAHPRYPNAAVALNLFVDPAHQRRLAGTADPHHSLRLSTHLLPHSSTQLELPLFAQIQLSRLVPAGAYTRPLDLELAYQARAVPPADSRAQLNTGAPVAD